MKRSSPSDVMVTGEKWPIGFNARPAKVRKVEEEEEEETAREVEEREEDEMMGEEPLRDESEGEEIGEADEDVNEEEEEINDGEGDEEQEEEEDEESEEEGEEDDDAEDSDVEHVENEDAEDVQNIFPDLDEMWGDLQAHLDGQDEEEINFALEDVAPTNEAANQDEFGLLWDELVLPADEELGGVAQDANWALLSDGDQSE